MPVFSPRDLFPAGTFHVFSQTSPRARRFWRQHLHTAYVGLDRGTETAPTSPPREVQRGWDTGICYGLSMLYLIASRRGLGDQAIQEVRTAMAAFEVRDPGPGESLGNGMLEYLAYLHLQQAENVDMMVRIGAESPAAKAWKLLGRTRALDGESPTDTLMRERGIRPFPVATGAHKQAFTVRLDPVGSLWTRECRDAEVRQLTTFIGPVGALSYVCSPNHAMAAVGAARGCTFFDPNWGSATFSSNAGMITFLRRMFSYIYLRDPAGTWTDTVHWGTPATRSQVRTDSIRLEVSRYH